MTVSQNGNVGIGTTNPALAKLEIWGTKISPDSYNYGMLNIHDTTASAAGVGGAISFSGYMDAIPNQVMGGSINLYKVNSTSGHSGFGLKFYTKTNNLNPSARVTIDDIGNVGIGTTSPEKTLEINGDILLSYNSTPKKLFFERSDGGATGQIYMDGVSASSNMVINSASGTGTINLAVDDISSIYVNSARKIGIGTTNPTSKLHVYNSTAATNVYVTIQNSLSTNQAALQLATASASANWIMYIPGSSSDLRLYNGSDRVVFLSNGTTQLNGTLTMNNQAINGVYSIQQHTSSKWKFDQNGNGYLSGILYVGDNGSSPFQLYSERIGGATPYTLGTIEVVRQTGEGDTTLSLEGGSSSITIKHLTGIFINSNNNITTLQGSLKFLENTETPSNPVANQELNVYVKGDKLIFQFNNAGTIRYKYLNLN